MHLEDEALLRRCGGCTAMDLLQWQHERLLRHVWHRFPMLKWPRVRPLSQTQQGVCLQWPQGTEPTLCVVGRDLPVLRCEVKPCVLPLPLKRHKDVLPPKRWGVQQPLCYKQGRPCVRVRLTHKWRGPRVCHGDSLWQPLCCCLGQGDAKRQLPLLRLWRVVRREGTTEEP